MPTSSGSLTLTALESNGDAKPAKLAVDGPGLAPSSGQLGPGGAARERSPSVTSRGNWGNRWEFLLSCVGLSVGIGNVWRFPYLAYKNGGGAFLIPYLIMLALAGKPMYFLELAFGQFAGQGPLTIWACAPICKGVGYAMVCVSMVVAVYYNVIMSYTLYYTASTFQAQVPWQRCDPAWANGTNCFVRSQNFTSGNLTEGATPSSQVYWERYVLDISTGIEDLGGVKWDLALCLLLSWIIVVVCLMNGIKTSGKVVYFAATFPYVILITLMVTGLCQPGAIDGVLYFVTPTFERLLDIKVWQAAAGQMFFSLSLSMGGLIMYSSYNKFSNNVFRDAMIVSVLDTVTSIISGMVIFSVLGAMAHDLGNVKVEDVAQGGPGLAFVAYPEALTRLPVPQLWSVLFFLMLFILGLDSEFAILETFVTSLSDQIPFLRAHKWGFTIVMGIVCFLLGLPMVTRGGQYVLELVDNFGGSTTLIFIGLIEIISLAYVYGYGHFSDDVFFMLDKRLGWYWRITWTVTSPLVLFPLGAHAGAGRAAAASALPATDGARRECSGTASKPPVGGSGAKLPSLRKGTGGRSSFNGVVCTVFGSNGSLGTSLINRLGKIGTQLILPYRCEFYFMQRLKLCGDLGQIHFQPFNLKDELSIAKAMKYSNVVINLIGKDTETSNFPFSEVHVKGAQTIARIARESGVQKLIHFSALNATESPRPIIKFGGSKFYASKWLGEQVVREEFPDAIIFRPADMYSHEDRFIRYYVSHIRRNYVLMPLWNKGNGIVKQPVFASDVAEGVVNAIFDDNNAGETYQAVGPRRYELGELVDYMFRVMRRDDGYVRYDMRYDLQFLARVHLIQSLYRKYPALSWERLEREHTTDEVFYELPTLEDLKVNLTSVEDRFPYELKYFREAAYYDPDIAQFEKVRPPPVVLE